MLSKILPFKPAQPLPTSIVSIPMFQEINDLVIDGDKAQMTYQPKEDITAYELSLLLKLFAFFHTGGWPRAYDYTKYIQKHGLERHFEFKAKG